MDADGLESAERIPASRKLGRDTAEALARAAQRVVVAKGRKVRSWSGAEIGEEAIEAMLGPTGNLRAPTVRSGKTVLVGFEEDAWRGVFG